MLRRDVGAKPMPIYEYQPDADGCEHCRDGFETMQLMSEPPLKTCPKCGGDVHRVISVTARPGKNILSNSNLKDHGFSKYVKRCDGQYTKEYGPGPDLQTYD